MAELGAAKDQAPAADGGLAALAEEIRKSGGSPALPGGGPGQAGSAGPVPAERQPLSEKSIRALVMLPSGIGYALTDNKLWLVDPEEEKALTEQTKEALEVFLHLDPKKFIGISLTVTLAAVYGTRLLAYLKERSETKKEAKA